MWLWHLLLLPFPLERMGDGDDSVDCTTEEMGGNGSEKGGSAANTTPSVSQLLHAVGVRGGLLLVGGQAGAAAAAPHLPSEAAKPLAGDALAAASCRGSQGVRFSISVGNRGGVGDGRGTLAHRVGRVAMALLMEVHLPATFLLARLLAREGMEDLRSW